MLESEGRSCQRTRRTGLDRDITGVFSTIVTKWTFARDRQVFRVIASPETFVRTSTTRLAQKSHGAEFSHSQMSAVSRTTTHFPLCVVIISADGAGQDGCAVGAARPQPRGGRFLQRTHEARMDLGAVPRLVLLRLLAADKSSTGNGRLQQRRSGRM